MYKTSQLIILSIIILLGFSNNIYVAHASEVKTWVRGATEIVEGYYEYEREPGICGGEGTSDIGELTESDYSSSRLRYYEICSGYYNMVSSIGFDSPQKKIAAGSTVHLKANGTKVGKQNCCFIYDWFYYDGTCASLGSGEEVFLNLRILPLTEFIIPETGKKTTGYNGTVTDNIDVALTMPTSGTECTVTGHAPNGLWLRWVYEMQIEQLSDLHVISLDGPSRVVCSDFKEREYTVRLENRGSETDTGTLHIRTELELKGAILDKKDIAYSVTGDTSEFYSFRVKFPESMYTVSDLITATVSSDNGTNDTKASLNVSIACRIDSTTASNFLLYYILKKPD